MRAELKDALLEIARNFWKTLKSVGAAIECCMEASPMSFFVVVFSIAIIAFYIKYTKKNKKKKNSKRSEKKQDAKILILAQNARAMSPAQFFEQRDMLMKTSKDFEAVNFQGVYVLHNKTKDLFYVGQAQKIYSRVNNHFTGHGNGDVYADYKYGDRFVIRLLPLKGSGYKTLNELERYAIHAFNAFEKGYNKTQGNKD